MRRQLITAFLVGLAITACCRVASGQSCGTSYSRSYNYSYGRTYTPSYSYSYIPSYSYVAPAYVAPAKKEYKEEYVAPAVAYRFLLAFPVIDLPSYGAAYAVPQALQQQQPQTQQPQQQARGGAQDSQMQQLLSQQTQILEAVKKLDERTARIELRVEKLERTRAPLATPKQEEGPAPKQEGDEAAFITVNNASCAACHSRSNAEKHGGKFVFSEDDGKLARLTAEQREEVEIQIGAGKMPKISTARAKETGVKPLTQATADVIFKAIDRQKAAARKKG